MKNRLFLMLFLTIFCNVVFCQTNGNSSIVDHYKTRNFDCAIFTKSETEIPLANKFTPTRNMVDLVENALKKDLKKLNQKLINQPPIIHKNLKKYKRQYIGYIDSKGNKILYINFFWDRTERKHFDKMWLQKWIYVSDGGSFFWNIKYNLETDKLFELSINGMA